MSSSEHLKLVTAPEEGAPSAPADPLVGTTIDGRYQVEKVLGEGGMGVVYTATHAVLGKRFAIKVLKADVSKNDEIIERFRQEAQSASAIGSQHIIDISDFGSLPDGSTYFVMEYLDGVELTKAIEESKAMAPERVVHIAKQLCDGLGAAHERGIVHRDLKPDNIFLVQRGSNRDFVKVLDFGIAKVGGAQSKLTRAGQVFGTPHYMSPEQCSGHAVDHRTDIYALGIILYEMSVGRVPFDADNLMGILTKHIYEQPIPPHTLPPPVNVPAGLEAVILKCLAKQADARYQSMAEVRADLEALEQGSTPSAVMEALERSTMPMVDPTGQHSLMHVRFGDAAPEPKKSKLPLIIGLAAAFMLALVVGGGALYAFVIAPDKDSVATTDPAPTVNREPEVESPEVGGPASDPETGDVAAQQDADDSIDPETDPEPATPEPKADPEPVMVRIITEPAGVEVWSGGALLGNSPFSVPRPEGSESLTLELRQPGYRNQDVRLSRLTQEEVRVTLARERPVSSGSRGNRTKQTVRPPEQQQVVSPQPVDRSNRGTGSEVLDPWASGR